MVTPIGQLPGKVGALAGFIDKGRTDTVVDVALFAKEEFLAGPPRSGLRQGAKIGGRKWGAGFDVRKGNKPTALLQYRGPVHWVDRGTSSHRIAPKRRRGKKAIKFGSIVRANALHPGQRAKPFYPGVKDRVEKGAPKILQAGTRRNIAKAGFSAARALK